jgi:hypothetical protein
MSKDKLPELNEQISHTFEKVIANAQIKTLDDIIEALAQVDSETQRDILINKLIKKFEKEEIKIDRRAILKDIKNNNSRNPEMKKKTSLMSLTPPIEIIEVIKTDQGLRYCLPDYEMKDSIELTGVIYTLPKQIDLVKLPTERFIQLGFLEDNDSKLFEDILTFIYEHLDLSTYDFGYKVLTLWVLHTWLLNKFNTSPIIHFLGPYASGKSRAGDVLSTLAKRGLATVNLTGASIFRVNEAYQPTFIIDEVKLTGKDRDRDILELLNVRFQRGRKVIRINMDKSGLDSIQEFNVYGATALSGLDELPETPRSRAIVFIMEQNVRPVAKSLDLKKADIFRDRLCAFRGRYLEEKMPRVERFVKDGRLADAIEPLHQILKLVKPEIEPDFIKYFKEIEKDRKEETFDSFDAEVVRALIKCKDNVDQGKILTSYIAEKFNEKKKESDQVSLKTIGKVLTRLKFKKTRTTGGIHARFWDEKLIKRLCKKYGLSDESDISDVKNLISGETNIFEDKVANNREIQGGKEEKILEGSL